MDNTGHAQEGLKHRRLKSEKDPLQRLGEIVSQRRWSVLIASLVAFVIFGIVGSGALNVLSLSRFEVPDSESIRVGQILQQEFKTGHPNVVLLVTAKNGTVDDPAVTAAGLALTREIANEAGVDEAGSYWSRGHTPTLRSQDGKQGLIVVRMSGSATEVRNELAVLSPRYTREDDTIKVEVGGSDEVFRQAGRLAMQDFVRAELIILPSVFLLLVWVYRRVRLAAITVAIGLFAMLATLTVLRGVAAFTEVSTFAANLTLVMGLGLGIDYSLFVISRFREELAHGKSVHDAVVRSVQTAGRTVIFSGATVAASLLVLLVFPFPFLRSFAYAGVFVVAAGIMGAILPLPAALAVLGTRAARRSPRRTSATMPSSFQQEGFWYRAAIRVMRRPGLYGGVALALLLFLGSPFLDLRFGLPDDRVLPPTASSRIVQEQIRSGFLSEEVDAIQILAEDIGAPAAKRTDIASYAAELSRVPGITQVDSLAGSFANGTQIFQPDPTSARFANETGTWISAVPSGRSLETDAYGLVQSIRAVPSPFPVQIGGYPAELSDFREALLARIPLVAILILGVTFLILFFMSGSLLIPIKATVLNILSLSVMFGSLVWVFQQGHLSGLLGFTATGTLEPSIPILMFCIAYGLSMDYEVFILSRIKEEYDQTGDNEKAVATGIQRSAPLVTSAAAILAFSFAAYASGEIVFLKMLGIGMALAVIVDATLIRAILVPAFMRLAGKANWWAPPALRRLHERFGISESEPFQRTPSGKEKPLVP